MAFDLNTVSPEVPKTPEIAQTPEAQEVGLEVPQQEQAPTVEYAPAPQVQPQQIEVPHQVEQPVVSQKDQLLEQVESILADKTVMKIYAQLPEGKKHQFKEMGEKVAKEISDGIRTRKLKPYKVLSGITKWLSIIPNVEKYYLLQEAKIDVDQVLALSEEQSSANAM